jgi:hypothetical protein
MVSGCVCRKSATDAEYQAREETDVTRGDPGVSIAAMMARKVIEVKLREFQLFAILLLRGRYPLLE